VLVHPLGAGRSSTDELGKKRRMTQFILRPRKDSTQHKQEYHDNSACPQYPGIQTVKSLCRKDEIRQIR